MQVLNLVLRSAWHHRRANLAILVGTAVATAVLTGARLTGDSFRFSLQRWAHLRLGQVSDVLQTGNRFVPADLAHRLARAVAAPVAPVLKVRGVGLAGGRQFNGVHVHGVDERFWSLALAAADPVLREDEVAINTRLAEQLQVKVGDRLDLRIRLPAALAEDAPLAAHAEDSTRRLSRVVRAIVTDEQLGAFSLSSDQRVPCNAFLRLNDLQTVLDREGQANLLAVGGRHPPLAPDALQAALAGVWRLEDVGIHVQDSLVTGTVAVVSDRVFLDRAVARAALAPGAVGTLSYLVSSLSVADGDSPRRTPYAFVTAVTPSSEATLSPVPADMGDDEIVISRWLADTLAAVPGSLVTMSYLHALPGGGWGEDARRFRVRRIVEMADLAAERARMPTFPGLSDVERCEDWDIGMPLDAEQLKDKANEAYWEAYGPTPKALVTLAAGRAMWGSRFGDLMTVRASAALEDAAGVYARLAADLNPSDVGLAFTPVRADADASVAGATDVGGLFLGLSVFLILAALMLTALLYAFATENRAQEFGILRAVGYRRWQIAVLLVGEVGVVAALGAVGGAGCGTLYTRALVAALQGPWRAGVGGTSVAYHAASGTLGTSALIGWGCAMLAMGLVLRGLMRSPILHLLQLDFSQVGSPAKARRGRLSVSIGWALASIAGGIGVAGWGLTRDLADPSGPFFLAGTLLLVGTLAAMRVALLAVDGIRASPAGISLRNASRRQGRSLAVIALSASGAFLVFAVASMRVDPAARVAWRDSGSGGFCAYAEAALPLPDDPRTPEGLRRLRLQDVAWMQDVRLIPLKVHEGDEAGCVNLARPKRPRIIGVPAPLLRQLGAFGAAGAGTDVWMPLAGASGLSITSAVPALAGDRDTAMWSLSKILEGPKRDSLGYEDEQGRPFPVRIAGSLPHRLTLFHGSILIPLESFAERFPSESGYRALLIDAPSGSAESVRRGLQDALAVYGVTVESSGARLASFNAVENIYLSMFLVLGGLGLLLGSAGVGMVLLRSGQERRGELAALVACGWRVRAVRRLLWMEHAALLAAGLACGAVAAAVAMLPALLAPGVEVPIRAIAGTFAAVLGTGVLAAVVTAFTATRGHLLDALRGE